VTLFEDRGYQDEAIERAVASLKANGGYALFMEQRTGKTLPACRIVLRIKPQRLLIVCPKIAERDIWQKAVADHQLDKGREVEIISMDTIRNKKERRRLKKRWQPDFVVADELHNFKDRNSKRSRALRSIARKARYRLGLTGTPQESGLEDYWAQFDFVDPKLFGDWDDFKARYLRMGGWFSKKVIGYRNADRFSKLLRTRSFRVLLEDVKPVKTKIEKDNLIRFDLRESRSIYNKMEKEFIAELNKKVRVKKLQADGSYEFVWEKKKVVATRVITQAMKLHQITSGFIFDEDSVVHRFGDEKLEQAGALLLELHDRPVVFFVRFLPELYRLGRLARRLGRKVTYISGSHKDYVSGTPFDVAIVQIRSGVAIDLAYAEEAVMYSWTHSHLTHDQARFRIRSYHGIRARYHYLIARGTIDEQLRTTVVDKVSFASLVLDTYRRK